MGAQGPLALCNSGLIPKLIMFLLICFIAEVTRGERKPSVSLSQLFSSWLCHKCPQWWMEKKMYQVCPKARVFQWPEGGCCGTGLKQIQEWGTLWGCWGRKEGGVAPLRLLSALLCIQPAEAHYAVPVLARGGLQDDCGPSQQREN